MKRLLWLIALILVLVVAWQLMPARVPPCDRELTVMTFNINTFRSELQNGSHGLVKLLLKTHQPDVVCLQEAVLLKHGRSLEEFAIESGYPYCKPHEQYIAGKRVGIAVLSRFPFVRDTVFGIGVEQETRFAQAIVLDLNGDEVTVINTHFSNRDFWLTGGRLQMLRQEYFQDNLRTFAATSIVRFLDSGWCSDLTLLAGDLNTLPFSRAWRILRSRLRDTAGWKDFLQPTYKVEYQVHIDYVLTSNTLHTLNYRILSTVASDHNPLLVSLGWESPPADAANE